MKGLRTQENDRFLKYFQIVQTEAQKKGKLFFVDYGDGNLLIDSDIECEDLAGWLIDANDINEFDKYFQKFQDVPEKFNNCYSFVSWQKNGNTINISFKTY